MNKKLSVVFFIIASHLSNAEIVVDKTCQKEMQENIFCDITTSPENPLQDSQPIQKTDNIAAYDVCTNNSCILITGDTQYPRTLEGIDKKDKALKQLQAYFTSIKSFAKTKSNKFKGIIINGDITEFGHPDEISTMQTLFSELAIPVWFGLGNHDYINNANDCWMNRCVSGSLEWLVDDVIKRHNNITSHDYLIKDINEFPIIVREYIGSFAYRIEIEGIHFLQLNHHDKYEITMDRAFNAAIGKTTSIDIQPSKKWAREQLENAYDTKSPIVILSHDDFLSSYLVANSRRNQVSAHYFGHWHGEPQVIDTTTCDDFGGDKILSGTAFLGSGTIVEIDKEENKLYNYAFYNNNLNDLYLFKITPLKTKSPINADTPLKKEIELLRSNTTGNQGNR